MASQEHLQQLDDDDSSTSSSEESTEELLPPPPTQPAAKSSAPPKMRLKLSIRMPKKKPPHVEEAVSMAPPPPPASSKPKKTPPSKKKKVSSRPVQPLPVEATSVDDTDENVVKATVVESSDDDDEDDTVLAELVMPKTNAKKRPPPTRPIQLPPLTSPGLLLPPAAGVFRGDADANGFTTPASVFDHQMELAGYTLERRKEWPHRGSSIKREVGDLFDSNVMFSVNFKSLLPDELTQKKESEKEPDAIMSAPSDKEASERKPEDEKTSTTTKTPSAPPRAGILALDEADNVASIKEMFGALIESLKKTDTGGPPVSNGRKRKRPWDFRDMVPLSLTLPYPDFYIQQRKEYLQKVKEREQAIVASQEVELAKEAEKQKSHGSVAAAAASSSPTMENGDSTGSPKADLKVVIPPIPEPPAPPKISEFGEDDLEVDDSQHPVYLPKAKEDFVEHLDKNYFHITEGRYFGLYSNAIADPHFVGPNAPGINGTNISAGTGLATAHVGNTSTGSASLASTVYGNKDKDSNNTSGNASSSTTKAKSSGSKKNSASSSSNNKKGPAPTSSASDLKKIMEKGGDSADEMRMCIMRAAVYASRTGRHGQSFVGPNGETYPDVSKAFAAHAGLRPCMRCKNNKQGAYHCRLRRKHKDLDHDGGDSPAQLAPLFEMPLEDLIIKQ